METLGAKVASEGQAEGGLNNIDDIFEIIGGLGRKQWIYVSTLSFIHVYFPFHMLLYTFVGRQVPFGCDDQQVGTNVSAILDPEKCHSCLNKSFSSDHTSIVSEWNLTCERAWLSPLTMSCFMFGVLIGAVVLGWMSDAYGRKATLSLTLFFMIITNGLGALTQSFNVYCVTRIFNGFFCGGHILAMVVLNNELVGNKERGKAAILMSNGWSLGIVLMSTLAYFIQKWRVYTMVTSFIGFPFLLLVFMLPESPRWLQSKGRLDDANKVLKIISNGNGVTFRQNLYLKMGTNRTEIARSGKISDLFMTWPVTIMTLIMMYSWFVNSALYYGLTLVLGIDSEKLYTATALSGIVEVPSNFLAPILVSSIGRRKSLSGFMAACGLGLFLVPMLNTMMPVLVMIVALFGKLCISASFIIVYLHSSEIFPTYIRNSGMGLVAVSSRFGGIVSPYLAQLGNLYPNLHFILFGFLGVSAGILNLNLPETKGEILPETMNDLFRMLRNQSYSKNSKKKNIKTGNYQILPLEPFEDD